MKEFFSASVGITLEPFGLYHVLSLGLTVFAIAVIYPFRDSLQNWKHEKRFRYALGSFGILWELALYFWQIANGIWTYADTTPVALCFLSLAMGIYIMFTMSYSVFSIGYFWAVGGVVSILFPDILYGPDRFRFYQYVIGHVVFFVMFMYMVFVHCYYPTTRSFKKSVIYLILICFVVVLPLDWITNANFFFLIRADGTPFEIFEGHGYPLYLAGVVSLSLLVLYLWYLPVKFFMSPERKQHESIS